MVRLVVVFREDFLLIVFFLTTTAGLGLGSLDRPRLPESPKLLRSFSQILKSDELIKGCIVSDGAISNQKKISKQTKERKGPFLLTGSHAKRVDLSVHSFEEAHIFRLEISCKQ